MNREQWIEEKAKELKRLGIGGLARIHILPMLREAMSFADRQREERVAELERQLKVWENEPCPECGEHHQCGAIGRLKAFEEGQ